jgi:hypothetical protein
LLTDRVGARIVAHGVGKLGKLAQNAMKRKKLVDGITTLDGFTTSLAGAGTTLSYGHVMAASVRITGNATEPGPTPLHAQLHAFQIKDLTDELTSPIGTYVVTSGASERAFRDGFQGMIGNVSVHQNNEITIDGSDDAKGGVYSKMAVVLVQGRSPRAATVRREDIGGGATIMYHYDEYVWGERSSGNWGYEIYSDATSPSS